MNMFEGLETLCILSLIISQEILKYWMDPGWVLGISASLPRNRVDTWEMCVIYAIFTARWPGSLTTVEASWLTLLSWHKTRKPFNCTWKNFPRVFSFRRHLTQIDRSVIAQCYWYLRHQNDHCKENRNSEPHQRWFIAGNEVCDAYNSPPICLKYFK